MFLKTLTVASIFIYTVASAYLLSFLMNHEGYQLWDVKLDPLQLYGMEGWRTICYEGIDLSVAHVVCRQNGSFNATTIKRSNSSVSGHVITQVLCPSTSNYLLYGETNIMRCNISDRVLNTTETCTPAKIVCNTIRRKDRPYKGQVYLDRTETATPADGIVKVYLYDDWYPMCKNAAFTQTVYDSICRQYGYTESQNNWTSEASGSRSKTCVIATEFTCTSKTGSFECFTHCMIPNKYRRDSHEEHVALLCTFDITKKYLTSGSQALCALPSSHEPTCKNKSTPDKIIIGLLGFLLFISVLLFCYKKRKCYRCCRNHENFNDYNSMCNIDGPINDPPLNDQISQKNYQSTEH